MTRLRLRVPRANFPLLATFILSATLYALACLQYDNFFSFRVFINLFAENAWLGIVAVGMTYVILSGGIDLSVGAVVACSSVFIGALVVEAQWHPLPAMVVVIAGGVLFGALMGGLIHAFEMPAFIVTLGGMFLARGVALVVGESSRPVSHGFLDWLLSVPGDVLAPMGGAGWMMPTRLVVFLIVLLAGWYVLRMTRFGRSVYAVGGGEMSAKLMGLHIARTKVGVYAISGGLSALAGAVFVASNFSADPNTAVMLELDAIAAVVIGGTLLTGGVGSMVGTLLGVFLFGLIQTAILFDGRLESHWARIVMGSLLLAFILLQRLLERRTGPSAN